MPHSQVAESDSTGTNPLRHRHFVSFFFVHFSVTSLPDSDPKTLFRFNSGGNLKKHIFQWKIRRLENGWMHISMRVHVKKALTMWHTFITLCARFALFGIILCRLVVSFRTFPTVFLTYTMHFNQMAFSLDKKKTTVITFLVWVKKSSMRKLD